MRCLLISSAALAKGRGVDQRADIYAFGLILYDMLVGRARADASSGAIAELQGRMQTAPPAAKSLVPQIPEPLNRLGVVVSGSIDHRGSGYELSVKAVQAVTGSEIASARSRASSKDQVLDVVTRLVTTFEKRSETRHPTKNFWRLCRTVAANYSLACSRPHLGPCTTGLTYASLADMRLRLAPLPFLFVLLLAVPATAQTSYGLRAGASAEPDQFYFGGHVETKELVENLTFRPNVEIGIGNDVTLVGINFELAYKFPTNRAWRPYAGGGPALNIINVHDESEAQGGFNIMLGVEHRGGLFFEVKVGTMDSPDFKFGIGYRFR